MSTYNLSGNVVVFTDSIVKNTPVIFNIPRNHESLFYVLEGELIYEKEALREFVSKGQVGYIARGSIDKTSAYNCDAVSYIAINFNFETKNPSPLATLNLKTLCGASEEFKPLFEEILKAYTEKSLGHKIICEGLLLQIIGMLYVENDTSGETQNLQKLLAPALDAIRENFHDSTFKTSALCELCDMSERNLRRYFIKAFGKSPYTYLQEFRIEKAKILLAYTANPITQIAEACGFTDLYSFSHAFKKREGISPKNFRINL